MALRVNFLAFLIFFFFFGCVQREYFKPEAIAGERPFGASLPSAIVDSASSGAVLKDGQIITSNGLLDFKLKEGESFVSFTQDQVVVALHCNTLRLYQLSGEMSNEIELEACPVSATKQGDELAVITNDNALSLYKLSTSEKLYSKKSNSALAVTSVIYPPIFHKDLIFYPMLDGNVIVLNRKKFEVDRTIVVNSETFFNNIMFLEVKDGLLLGATSKKILSLVGENTYTLDEEIRSIQTFGGKIYLSTLDGQIKELDFTLKTLRSLKFPFASLPMFVIYQDKLYALEDGSGFLIVVDLKDFTALVYKTNIKRGKNLFSQHNMMYYDKQSMELK